jgi:multiple sugar transport system ATP-binding protein
MAEIHLEKVRKTFGDVVAVRDVEMKIHDREFMVLLGPSGCGKSTLLRCVAGLEQVDGGRVCIGEQDVTFAPPARRRIAMVFQSYAVFPHMTVFDNIGFGLRMQRWATAAVQEKVHFAAELLHIEDLLQRYPAQLSGGQRQRVAVARAIAVPSQVLLMDEPLSNLDALLRLEMRAELKKLLHELESTVIYVTHDQVEALSMGDRIAVMRAGEILQCDSPIEVYNNPANHFIGTFIGNPPMNFLTGQLGDGGNVVINGTAVPVAESVSGGYRDGRAHADEPLWVGIRAENIEVIETAVSGTLPAEVMVVEPLGSHNLLTVQAGQERLKVNSHADATYRNGQNVWLRLVPDKIRLMDKETGVALRAEG